MKIAFVNDTFLEGRGADTVIYELARRLGKKHEIFVIASETDFREENFKIIKINGRKLLSGNTLKDSLSYLPNIRTIRKEIKKLHKRYKFDIINLHHSSLIPAFNGLPTIVTWNGSPPSKNLLRKSLNKSVLNGLKNNMCSITLSDYLKSRLVKIINKKNVKRIYCGVDENFTPINKDEEYMFYVGRLEEHKAIHELIRLSKEINYPLVIAGSGPLELKLKNYSKRIKADKVIFLGKISKKELIKQYQKCSFFVSASKWEGFGLIFLEAAACEKPSIGYNAGSIPEVIQNNKTGFVVNNYSEFREKAKILIENKNIRRDMGKNALNFRKNFSWDKAVTEYENLFVDINKSLKGI